MEIIVMFVVITAQCRIATIYMYVCVCVCDVTVRTMNWIIWYLLELEPIITLATGLAPSGRGNLVTARQKSGTFPWACYPRRHVAIHKYKKKFLFPNRFTQGNIVTERPSKYESETKPEGWRACRTKRNYVTARKML